MKEGRRRGIWRVVALVLAVLLIVESMPLNALAAAYHRYSTAGNNSYIPLVSSQDDDDGWDEEDRDGDLIDDRDLSALGTLSLGWNNRLASGSNASMSNALLMTSLLAMPATATNAYRSGDWSGPTEGGVLTAANNYIRLDSANTVLKQPSDFAIGKYGERTFNLEFGVRPEEIPAADRSNVGIEILIPAGFNVQSVPTPNGSPFTKQNTADGQVLIARPNVAVAGVSGQITLQQNALQLINDLALTEGKYRFQIRVFKNYGTPQQTLLTTTTETIETASLSLETSNQNPTYTITNDSDSFSWMPGDISFANVGRRAGSTNSGTTSADSDAKMLLASGNYSNDNLITHQRKGFQVSVHKTEGYVGPGAQFEFKLPDEGNLFEKRGVLFYWFESDDGITLPVRHVGDYNSPLTATVPWSDGIYRFDANTLYTRFNGTDYAKVERQNANVSNVDLFRKAGTFHFMFFPIVRYNQLYTGNWSATNHTAAVGSEFKAPDNELLGDVSVTGSPLKFNFIQGTQPITLDNLTLLDAGLAGTFNGSNINSLPQYDSTHPEWADSRLLEAQARFNDGANNFKIQDDLKVVYDFGEELAPVHFENLGTGKDNGLSYRFYIKDAVTGAIRLKTILAEGLSASYTPQTVSYDGVNYSENAASIVDGTGVTSYDFTEADNTSNTEYIARVEVFKDIYGYNTRGAYYNRDYASIPVNVWFNYKLRAYHHRMSNGQDIPDNFAAHVNRSISSKQILENGGQPLTKDVTIKTRHLVDRLDVVPLNTYGVFEVNKHSEINPILRFGVTKYAETMDYNVDTNGSAYVYGDPNYNPPVVEVSGAGVEITDHLEKANQRLLGFWDENDVYHDFQADGFDPDQPAYLKDGVSMYSDTKLTVMGDPNDTGAFEGQVYDLEAIFNHYGVRYAKRLVLAQEKLNDWKISGLFETRWTRLFAQQVAPGHLNYDNVIGTNGAADLPKRVTAEGRLYCEYSDYKSERVNGGPPHDANKPGGTPFGHGTAWPQTLQSAQFVLGDKAKGISVKDFDYYINPFTPVTTYYKQTDLVNPGTATEYDRSKMKVNTEGLGADQNAEDVVGRREIELTRIAVDNSDVPTNYNVTTKAQLAYRNVVYDFAGTDARLLSLTNVVSFGPLLSNRYSVPFEIEYTLSNGQTKTISDLAKYSYAPNSHGRMFVQLPDVDIANGVYVTALKVKVPSDYNWGQNTQKYGKDPAENSKRMLPEIGLGMYNVSVPKKYPGTNDKIGSVSDHESDDSYDKLTVKAKLSFEDVFGTTTSYDTTGTSERIAGQRVLVDHMGLAVSYGSTNTYQGNILQVGLINGFTASDTTSSIVKAQALKIRPTYYYKIDKSFNYVDGSLVATAGLKNNNNPPGLNPRTVPSGVVTHFVPAGTGVGQSGSDDYGILVVSYENVPEADLASGEVQLENYNGTALYGGYYSLSFKLQAKYNADPVNVKPVMGVWLDTDFDADRDGTQGGNPQGIAVELANSRNQLVNDGPVGADFFNQGTAKISAATGKAEMLYADTTTLHKINQQAILGLLAYAQSTIPFNESSTEVSSRDIRSNDNIFSTKVYITGDNSQNTSHWELYIPVMKKGERYSYTSGGTTNQTAPNEYELDYYGIDTSTLAGLNYSVAYTTDPNPGAGGYATAKAANYSATVPANKADVTMVRVKIDNVNPSKKSFVKVQYKLHDPKTFLGSMKNQNVVFGNFNMGSSTTPYFGSTGQASLPLTYTLKDMEISGFVWDETDRNSTYNAGTDSLLQNVRFRVYDPATNTQVQLNSAPNGDFLVNSRADGTYTVLVPHDGNWIVEADTRGLAAEKKLVLQNKNGRPAIDSAFDRETNRVTTSVVVDTFRNLYSRENVNAGFYTAPKITIPNLEIPVGGGATPITAVVTDPVTPGVTFSIPSGQPTDIVTLQNSGTTTGSTTPQKTGTVTVTAETDDGYGGKVKTTATVQVYTDIEYDANNGIGTVSPNGDKLYPSTDNTGADAHTDEGIAKSVSGTGTDTGFTRPGYLFTGWNTAADGSGQSYAPGATVKTGARTAPLKLYAQWQQLTPVAEAFKIKKNVSGDWGTLPNTEVSPLLPSNFKFVMTSISANAPMPAGATSTTNPSNVTGAVDSVLFSMSSSDFSATVTSKEIATGLLTFTMPGTYSYVVQELNDGVTNYSYDSTQYKVTYTVTTGVGGTLAAQRSIENLTTSAVSGQVVFDNAYDLPTYQVTFDPQGGDVTPTTQTVKYGHYAGEPTTPAGKSSSAGDKTGYDFRGWVYEVPDPVTGAMTEVPFAFATTAVKQNYALKAKWELRKLVVVVTDAPDADGTHANEEIFRKNDVPYGTTTAEPTRPSNKTGYHFDRWLDNTNNPYDFTQPVTKNETIHATYLPNTYKVRYNANAGDATGTMTDSDHVYDVAKNLNSNAFSRPGYVFDGWNTEANGSGTNYTDAQSVMNLTTQDNAVVNLYAKWTPVTPAVANLTIQKTLTGDRGPIATGETAPLVAETFSFTLQAKSAAAGTAYPMPAGTTAGAQSQTYTIPTSDLASGSASVRTGNISFQFPGVYEYEVTETQGSATGYTYDNKVYTVRYTATQTGATIHVTTELQDGAGAAFTAVTSGDATAAFTNDYQLPKYQVEFDADGGSVTPSTQTGIKRGGTPTEPTAASPSTSPAGDKTGHHFVGWFEEDPSGNISSTPYDFTAPLTGNKKLKAKWAVNEYKVKVKDAPTADGTHANEVIHSDDHVPYNGQIPSQTAPNNKTGYHFNGWVDESDNSPYTFGTPVQRDTTVVATYAPNNYKVHYEPNGTNVSGTVTDSNHVYDVAKNLNQNNFTRPGYTFGGWNTQANGGGQSYTDQQSVTNLTTTDNGTVTLYAVWTPVGGATEAFSVKKTLTGDVGPLANGETAPLTAENFRFELKAVSTTAFGLSGALPMPAAAAGQQTYVMQVGTAGLTLVRGVTDTQAGESNGTVTSGPFSFTMPGEYVYEVKELGNGVTGYTYDSKVYTLKYKVQQVGTILTVTKEVSENGGSFTAFTGALDFTNDYQRPQYTVTYDADGGNVTPSTETVKHGNKATEPQTQTGHTSPAGEKTGYHFGGWIDTATNTPYNFNTPVTGNKNLKAKWDINQYRVIVKEPHDADPGMQDHEYLNNPNVNHGDTVTAPPTPNNKTGHHFNGWVDQGGNPYTFGTPVTGDTTVTATYAPNNYKVHYEPNGTNVSGTVTDSNHVYDVAKNLNQNNFTRPGYTFGGWNTQANGGGQSYTDQQSVTNLTTTDNGTVTLYAVWTPVGGATEAFSVKKTLTGDVGPLANGETAPLTAENFRFELKAVSTTAFGLSGALPMPAAAAGQQTYVMQVGTAGLTLVRGVTDTQAGESNGTVTSGPFSFTMPGEYVYEVKELGNGVTGYTYDSKVYTLKYKVQQVGTILTVTKEVSENGGSFTAFTGALDFTNDYQRPQYTVTYDADGGNVTPSTETVKHGNKATEPQTQTGHTSPAGEKTGYHFGGWIDTATNTPYNFNTPVTGNKNLKAKWDINQYRVIVKEPHDADPGMQDHEYLNNPNVNHGDTVTAPPTPNNKTGHHFNGWVDQGGNPYTFGTPVTGDTTVTATYAPNNYTVQYDKNASDATGTVPDSTHVYDVARNLNNNTYTRPGYEFAGWATTPTGTVTYPDQQSVINLTNQNNGVVKLYAVWTQATPATEAFGIRKTLSGDVGQLPNGETAPIIADTFTFRLTAKQTNAPGLTALPMPLGTVAGAQTADFTISSSGLSYGSFGTAATGTAASGLITFTLPGDYYYEVTELAGSAAGYTYGGASKVYTLHYKVTQSGTTLSVTKAVKEGSGAYAPLTGALAFDNSYALPSYTVTFNAQGGDVTPVTQTVKYGHFATRPQTQAGKSSPAGDLAGHTFQHWNKQGDPATTAYDFEHTPVTGNIILNANWSTNSYTITVTDSPDANPPHQNEVISNTTVTYNTPSTEPNRPNNRTGYHFDHWEKNNDPSHTPYTFGTPVTGNETIHAVYAPNRYTVRYNKDAADASGTVADSSHTYDVPQNLNNNAFTRPGYEFAGWSRTQGSTTVDFANQASVVNLSDTDGAVVDLYAVWTAATPVTANVTIQKTLTGDITTTPGGLASPVTPETFRFELKAISTTAPGITALPMPAAAAGAQTAVLTLNTNDLTAGSGSVQTGNITFTMPGEYIYELKELPSTAADFTFDQTIYGLKYTVTQNGTTLSVAAQSKTGSNAYQNFAGTASFTNDYQLPKFRVTYDSDLGSATPPTENNIKYGHFATQPGNAVGTSSPAGDRTGYHFQHWIDIQTGQIFNFGDPITRDVNLKAVWARNTYTVTVNDGPDATTPNQNISTQTVTHGDPSTEPNRPNNKPGYHFGGWQTGSNTPYTFGTPVTENQTIHATYTPNHYTVRYEANGSNVSGTVANSQHTYDVAAPLTQNSYTRPGYQFGGWATRPDGTGTQYTDRQSVMNLTQVDGDTVSLYAIWTPVTPYQLDLGVQKLLTGEVGLSLATGETSPLNTEAFRFKLSAVSTTAAGASALPMPNGTVGAQETEISINGAGTGTFGPIDFVYEGDYIYRLTEVPGAATGYTYDPAVYEITVRVSQSGITMNGTASVKKNGGTATAVAGNLAFSNDYQLPRFNVSFNPDGGSSTPNTQTVRYGDPVVTPGNAPGTNSPAGDKTGYHFKHWAKPDGTPYHFGDPVTSDTLLIAIWEINRYTITVTDAPDANPGHQNRIITTDNQVPHGTVPTEPTHPDNKTDYVFDHWEKPDGTPYRFDEPMTGNITVHAVYRQKQYNVTFEQNGSNVIGNMPNQHFNGGETKPLTGNTYARPGYVFSGWGRTPVAVTPDFADGQTVSNLTGTDGDTVHLYAIWTPVTPAVVSVPTVIKQITGDTPHNAGQFSFTLTAVSTTASGSQTGIPMPAAAQGDTDRITVDGAGQGNFGDITFRLPGTYVYRIAELPEGRKGFSFDPDEVTLTYIVTQNGLNLNVTTSAQKNGNPVTDATFVNRFTVPDYTITFDGNGSWICIPTQSVREGNHGTDPQTTMLRTESKFIGWYLNGQPYDFNTPVYDDITLVAMYEYKPSEDNSGGSGGGGGGNGGGGNSSHRGGKTTPNTNPLNPGISDTTVVPPVSPTEPSPDLPAEEKRTPHGEAISPTERHKTTVVTGTSKRSKRGKLPKTGEAPISNPLPQLATLTLAAYALLAEEKRRREQTK